MYDPNELWLDLRIKHSYITYSTNKKIKSSLNCSNTWQEGKWHLFMCWYLSASTNPSSRYHTPWSHRLWSVSCASFLPVTYYLSPCPHCCCKCLSEALLQGRNMRASHDFLLLYPVQETATADSTAICVLCFNFMVCSQPLMQFASSLASLSMSLKTKEI